MKNIFIINILISLLINNIQGRSEEYKECVNPDKTVYSSSDCTKIEIPDSEGYKCCSMKITLNQDSSYSCIALENKYTTSQEILNEYMSKKNISYLFASLGGKMEIDCGNKSTLSVNYKKLSDEYLNCYNNHIKSIENENNCTKNDIPSNEGSKCCFVETSTKSENGKIINDKRCYLIQDEYFTKNKSLYNYLLDESKNNLNEYSNTNITINCKNYDTFFYSGFDKSIIIPSSSQESSDIVENTEKIDTLIKKSKSKDSGLKAWAIILIILGLSIFIGIIVIIFVCLRKSKKISNEKVDTTDISNYKSNSNANI